MHRGRIERVLLVEPEVVLLLELLVGLSALMLVVAVIVFALEHSCFAVITFKNNSMCGADFSSFLLLINLLKFSFFVNFCFSLNIVRLFFLKSLFLFLFL